MRLYRAVGRKGGFSFALRSIGFSIHGMPSDLSSFVLVGDTLPGDAVTSRFQAAEAISEPYAITVTFTTEDSAFRVESCLRNRLCLAVTNAQGEQRFFDGVVDQARFIRSKNKEFQFEVRLRPALAALAHREGCRIFQNQSIVDIIQTIFDEAGFGDKVEWRLSQSYEPREFVVQYRETHLNFVSRLMEDNGLFYFFVHNADGHTMVIGDNSSAFTADSEARPVVFGMAQGGGSYVEPLRIFSRRRAIRASSVHLLDFDFEKPGQKPDAQLPGEEVYSQPYFEYPGGFVKGSEGARLAQARLRRLRADADICSGESSASGLRVGVPFTVIGAAEACLNGEFVIVRLGTEGSQVMSGGRVNQSLGNQFEGIQAGAAFAPERRARKPRICGVQTAIVTGSSTQDQSITTDKYGRIKVRFYWDRINQQNETSSCWLRVCQVPLGGSMILPRLGWEVSVAFLDGDPDRPFVLGRVYNAEKTPPYALPGNKATGALKSMSSPGAAGYNEVSMNDSGGSQGLNLHAQKDMNITILHDKVEDIGVDEQSTVTVNAASTVKVDESVSVGGNQSLNVGAVLSQNIGGNQGIQVGGNDVSNATANCDEKITGNRDYTVGGNQITICNGIETNASGDISRTVGTLELRGTLGSINDNVLGSHTENIGAIKAQLVAGIQSESVSGSKSQTYAAAELHLAKGNIDMMAAGSVTHLVGGLHYSKVAGDYTVKAPIIALIGAVGVLKGGGSEIKLGGGPVVIKGSKVAIETALLVKLGGSLTMGN